jgi:hypothetical protein
MLERNALPTIAWINSAECDQYLAIYIFSNFHDV